MNRAALLFTGTLLATAIAGAQITMTAPTSLTATVGQPYSGTISASGGTGPYTFAPTSCGPGPGQGISVDANGNVGGTPTIGGSCSLTVGATDSVPGETGSLTFSITIDLAVSGSFPGGVVGAAYSTTLTAQGGTSYTWSLTSGTLPAGVTLDGAAGTISGTPTVSGSFPITVTATEVGVATGSISGTIVIAAPPLPVIGTTSLPDGAVGTSYSATFSASGGTGSSSAFTWTVSAGALPPGLTLSTAGVLSQTPTAAGTFTFTVQVSDTIGTIATAAESIIVHPAVSISGTLGAGTVGLSYSGSLTASGGTGSGYAFTVTSGTLPAGLSLSSAGAITGTPTASGTSNFTVHVVDSGSFAASSSESITINPAVSITSGSPPGGTVNVSYTASFTATGGSGSGYSWVVATGSLPAGLSLSSGGSISGTPTAAGTSNFTVRVTDSGGATATASESITIAPALAITTTALPSGALNAAYSATLAATGGTPSYTWSATGLPAGLSLNTSTGAITGTPTAATTATVNVQVTDSRSVTASKSLSVTIASALAIATASLPDGSVGAPYSASVTQAGGNAPYTWTATGLPAGLTLNTSTGAIGGTPTTAGTAQVNFQVADTNSVKATKSLSLVITPALGITTTTLPGGYVSVAYSATLAASGGNPAYTWSLAGGALPAGLNLSAAGSIAGTPTQVGPFNFVAKVADAAGTFKTQALTITIGAALAIATTQLPTGAIGTHYEQTLVATGGATPYAWSLLAGQLPAGLSLSAAGALSGTPSSAGTFAVTIKVIDNTGNSVVKSLSVTIASGLTITSTSPLPVAAVGSAYSQALAAISGAPPYTWSISAGSLPNGIKLDAATGVLSGTPAGGGTFSFTVKVKDAASGAVTKQFTLTVVGALTVMTTSLPGGTLAAPYAQVLSAVAGTSPYTWSISTGSLPPGLTLNTASGAITGTPTSQGTYNFTVRVTDAVNALATKALTIVIGLAPVVSSGPALSSGTLGKAYSTTLAATGGTPPYSWSISAGSLPAGLTLDGATGAITGTPQAAGAFNFTAKVTDAAQATGTAQLSLSIGVSNLPAISVGGLSDTAAPLDQPTLSLSLASAAPTALTGQLTLTFESDAAVQGDDPSIQFSTGGRSVDFSIAAGSTAATFPQSSLLLQTGSVAGTITLTVKLSAGGADVTPNPAPAKTVKINRTAPGIRAVTLNTTGSGFEVWITGYSPSRELTQAVVSFTGRAGSNLQTTSLTVPLSTAASQWFQDAGSQQYGSQFRIVQPFTVVGTANAVSSVSVTLSNAVGASTSSSASF